MDNEDFKQDEATPTTTPTTGSGLVPGRVDVDFVSALHRASQEALEMWIRQNAPVEVRALWSNMIGMDSYCRSWESRGGMVISLDDREIADLIISSANIIGELSGASRFTLTWE
jgi:hypothetical protein